MFADNIAALVRQQHLFPGFCLERVIVMLVEAAPHHVL